MNDKALEHVRQFIYNSDMENDIQFDVPSMIARVGLSTEITFKEIISFITDRNVFVFDFDGTIADSEVLHLSAYNKILSKYNIFITKSEFELYRGNDEFSIYEMIEDKYKIQLPFIQTRIDRLAYFMKYSATTPLYPFTYISHLLDIIETSNAQKIILSSQNSSIIGELLNKWSLLENFSSIMTPDLFLSSKVNILQSLPRRFGRLPNEFVVIEDSYSFLDRAKGIGMRGYMVTSE